MTKVIAPTKTDTKKISYNMLRAINKSFFFVTVLFLSASCHYQVKNKHYFNDAANVYAKISIDLIPTLREIKVGNFKRVENNEKDIFKKYKKEIVNLKFEHKMELTFLLLTSCRISKESIQSLSILLGDDKDKIVSRFLELVKDDGGIVGDHGFVDWHQFFYFLTI